MRAVSLRGGVKKYSVRFPPPPHHTTVSCSHTFFFFGVVVVDRSIINPVCLCVLRAMCRHTLPNGSSGAIAYDLWAGPVRPPTHRYVMAAFGCGFFAMGVYRALM